MKTQLKVSIVVFAAVFFAATLFAMLYVGALIVVDILYGVVDPRIRVTKGEK